MIRAEGSIFIIGVEQGIKSWKKHLKPGGFLAFTEAVWFTILASEKTQSFWKERYPAMKTAEKIKDLANDTGYRCTDFPLTASAWWQYYSPLIARLNEVKRQFTSEEAAAGDRARQRAFA